MELWEYLVNKFGPAPAKKVYYKIKQVLKSISLYPESYPASKKHIRSTEMCVQQTNQYLLPGQQ